MVFQTNQTAVHLYDRLDFVRLRPMVLIGCRVWAESIKRASEASGTAEVLDEA
jgi:hypothetical protein